MCNWVLVSCKDKESHKNDTALEHDGRGHGPEGKHDDGDRKGPPPPHGGDRKGPPKGGSPEQTKTIEEIGGYNIGDVATDFNLKNVDGSMVSLASIERC